MDDATFWLIVVVLGLAALLVALNLLVLGLWGAGSMLNWALAQGFVGLAAFIALWVFLFPLMAVLAIGYGGVRWWAEAPAWRIRKRKEVPPADPEERRKWAN